VLALPSNTLALGLGARVLVLAGATFAMYEDGFAIPDTVPVANNVPLPAPYGATILVDTGTGRTVIVDGATTWEIVVNWETVNVDGPASEDGLGIAPPATEEADACGTTELAPTTPATEDATNELEVGATPPTTEDGYSSELPAVAEAPNEVAR
jgi:hypothetical protein